jgi:hypothetical protein
VGDTLSYNYPVTPNAFQPVHRGFFWDAVVSVVKVR